VRESDSLTSASRLRAMIGEFCDAANELETFVPNLYTRRIVLQAQTDCSMDKRKRLPSLVAVACEPE